MRKNLLRIFALLLVVILSCGVAGCALFQFEEYDPGSNYDDDYVEPDYDFTVTCTSDETTIVLGNVGTYGETANLVYLKPYQYLKGEQATSRTEETNATPIFVAEYDCGTEATLTISRYNAQDYDTVYCKFYVITDEGNILAGPIYPTDVEPIYKHDEIVRVNGIKGVTAGGGTFNEVEELGCEYVQLGVMTTGLIVPLELVDEQTGEITPIEYDTTHLEDEGYIVAVDAPYPYNQPQYVEAFYHNGTTYYFRIKNWVSQSGLEWLDYEVATYTGMGVKTTVLLLMGKDMEQYVQPYFILYKEARHKPAGYYAVNTANRYGAEYWSALTEFLAMRYSREDAKYGAVEAWVLGNEIDQSVHWNCLHDPDIHTRLSTEEYATEYERMMRITNQSFKKVYERNIALVPITHWWNGNGGGSDYNPRDIIDYFCSKTRSQGNYNWGLAIHPYGAILAVTPFWSNDVTSSFGLTGSWETTKEITWTNLEVLQLYLEQDLKRCNGEIREVYVTEGGVSSSSSVEGPMVGEDKYQQVAGVAYAYYKATQLSCITALNYYKLIDSPEENAYFGLMTPYPNPVPKPSYYVYKAVDTAQTWSETGKYLEYITWSILENGSLVPHGYGIDVGFDWQMAMRIIPSQFDWDAHWDESKIIIR